MQCEYNGIALDIIHTKSMTRRPVWSDDGTELRAMRFTYELICTYNPEATSYEPGPTENLGIDPAITDTAIRYALMEPRKQLLIEADDAAGTIVLESPAPGFNVDADNGPKPLYCNVTQITPATWTVAWGIQTDIIECPEMDDDTSPITSSRFSQTQHTGENHLTTITTKGVTCFRTDQLDNLGRAADFYRDQVIPGCPLNFKRTTVNVMVASPGNILAWTVVDQEQFTSIGGTDDPRRMGVIDYKDMFTAKSAPLTDKGVPSNNLICQFDIRAYGNQQSTLQGLINWCAAYAIERCAIPNGPVDFKHQALILSVSTEESRKDKMAGLHITFQLPPVENGTMGLGPLNANFIGVDTINMFANNGQNPQMPNDNNTRGTFNSQLFVQALKDACSAPSGPPTDAGDSVGDPSDNYLNSPQIEVNVFEGDLPDETSTNYSEDATTGGTYNSMWIESRFKTDRGVLGLPIASSDNNSGSGNDSMTGSSSEDDDDSDDVVIIQVSKPMTRVTYRWEAERIGVPPLVPDPCSNDTNLVLEEDEVSPMAVGLAPDGFTPVYRIGGYSTYICKKSRKANDPVGFGVNPWTNFVYTDDGTQFDNFTHGLIDDIDGSSNDVGDGGGLNNPE
jgi:hypothetical protein